MKVADDMVSCDEVEVAMNIPIAGSSFTGSHMSAHDDGMVCIAMSDVFGVSIALSKGSYSAMAEDAFAGSHIAIEIDYFDPVGRHRMIIVVVVVGMA